MNAKILNALLIVSSLLGYLEWGNANSSFLFEAEWEVVKGLIANPGSVAHPFTIIPLVGQLLLFISLFQKKPSCTLTYSGIACLGLLLGLIFLIAIMGFNLKILASTLPFILLAAYTIRTQWNSK